MDAAEIVVHEINREGVLVILNLLGVGVREAGKAPHGHPHRQILAFDVRRGNVPHIRLANDGGRLCPDARRGGCSASPVPNRARIFSPTWHSPLPNRTRFRPLPDKRDGHLS
jgi:hypothetical protein